MKSKVWNLDDIKEIKRMLVEKGFKVENIENGIHAIKDNYDIVVKHDQIEITELSLSYKDEKVEILYKIGLDSVSVFLKVKDKDGDKNYIVAIPNDEGQVFPAVDLTEDFVENPIATTIEGMKIDFDVEILESELLSNS
jgi:hypothetical protein